eukprot:TRINITY_DN2075_c0_g1_i1.p1 TRINITY_DN2075_c0_g1~~TRINITY_DN2075_c0_g1_i1.p1  ORF type:complete len:223 (-),score=44.28 TRINITY_DN2075_c0_g1_i1:793-1461(-)
MYTIPPTRKRSREAAGLTLGEPAAKRAVLDPVEIRKQKNRESAARSRMRKQQRMNDLENEVAALKARLSMMEEENKLLKLEVQKKQQYSIPTVSPTPQIDITPINIQQQPIQQPINQFDACPFIRKSACLPFYALPILSFILSLPLEIWTALIVVAWKMNFFSHSTMSPKSLHPSMTSTVSVCSICNPFQKCRQSSQQTTFSTLSCYKAPDPAPNIVSLCLC